VRGEPGRVCEPYGRHDQAKSARLWQESRQRGKEGAVGRSQQRAALLPSEHDQLMLRQQLNVFGEGAAAVPDQQPQHRGEGEISEGKGASGDPPITRHRGHREGEPRSSDFG
jgi:hypothetical protein